ncbi:MAG: outer membrane protein assembly factor BamD [Rikenellaceae bacterium]|nr:outer membrane protein assembly factor BamD [Rikenellaceae bacterium]
MRFRHIALILTAMALLCGCSNYDRLVKGRDYQKQYEEALRYYSIKKDNKAIALFDNIESIFSATDRIDTIKFYKAKANYRMGDYYTAVSLMDDFRKTFSRSPFAEESEYLYAMCYYRLSPNPELDQSNTALAINAFVEYIDRYPESARKQSCIEMIDELQSRIYNKTFMVGQTYYNIGYYNSAIHSFRNTLKHYPEIPQREQILYLLVKANYQYAKASVASKQRERYYNTIDAYYNFVSEYPESDYLPEVERMYKNAVRLARGEEAAEEVGKEFRLSSLDDSKLEKKASRIADRIENNKIAAESFVSNVDKSMKRIDKERGRLLDDDDRAAARLDRRQAKAARRRDDIVRRLDNKTHALEAKLDKLNRKIEARKVSETAKKEAAN